jgi:hypothetical protein
MDKSIEISVGMIFRVKGERGRTDIIYDTGHDDNIEIFQCKINPLRLIGCAAGTAEGGNIGQVVMTVRPEVVEKLLIDFWTENGSMDDGFRSNIHEAVLSKPRRINLP